MTLTPLRALGNAGEGHARRYLETKGYRFIARNWRCSSGEIDLIMRHHDEVVFVEVKTRRGEQRGRAEESISPRQAHRLLITAEWYLSESPEIRALIWRIDLVAITLRSDGTVGRLTHLINAVVSG